MVKNIKNYQSVSLIVRTKNEEDWIGHCLGSIFNQTYPVKEVVIVDNGSTDNTLKICSKYPNVKVISIKKYLPGLSLNIGIKKCKGDLVGILSSHCIPKDNLWLESLVKPFKNQKIAGVYGRQIPTSYSSHNDVRDLFITFGEESRNQKKDSFFHNANSMIRKDVWKNFPFDESTTNIEDRIWAQSVLKKGYIIRYESKAVVYHHHGIHHARDIKRSKSTLNVIKKITKDIINFDLPYSMLPENSNIQAIIPIPFNIKKIGSLDPINNIHEKVLQSKFITDYLFLYGEKNQVINIPTEKKLKSRKIGNKKFTLLEIIKDAIKHLNKKGNYPDFILYVNPEYIFKPDNFFDDLIRTALFGGYASTTLAFKDFNDYWYQNNLSEEYESINSKILSKEEKLPLFRALFGQGTILRPSLINSGSLTDLKNQGIIETSNINFTLKSDNKYSLDLIKKLL